MSNVRLGRRDLFKVAGAASIAAALPSATASAQEQAHSHSAKPITRPAHSSRRPKVRLPLMREPIHSSILPKPLSSNVAGADFRV